MAWLIDKEQRATAGGAPLAPYPAFPAVRNLDFSISLPHGHFGPPTFGVPLPNCGPVIYIPYLSCARRTKINGWAAARCGDLGLGLGCGSLVPTYEILTGSSNVWIESARAARELTDLTRHCIFSLPLGVPLGVSVQGSGNVRIGGSPMPSLTGMAIARALRLLFRGLSKLAVATSRNTLDRQIAVAREVYANSPALQHLRQINKTKDPVMKQKQLQDFIDWYRKEKGVNTVITDEKGLRKLGAGRGNDATLQGNTIHMGEKAWRNPDKATNEMIHEVGAKELSDRFGGKDKIPSDGLGQTHVLDAVTKGK
jgi:hypothetical protein